MKSYNYVGFFIHSYRYVALLMTSKRHLVFSNLSDCLVCNGLQTWFLLPPTFFKKNGTCLAYISGEYETIQQCIFLLTGMRKKVITTNN